jgi:hypothetical protein
VLEKFLRQLVSKRSEMERSVFDSPPSDWAGFQRRLGAYVELEELIVLVNDAMRGLEKDE